MDSPQGEKKFFDFVLGNPPFIGKSLMNAAQKADMEVIFKGVNGAGVLDYVSAWYLKAAQYMEAANIEDTKKTKAAFVSTNSISQGEQVGILWNELFNRYKVKIHFAHRTFSWQNEARGNAAVHVVIIGFTNYDVSDKVIYEYENIKAEPHEVRVKNINPYLVEGKDLVLLSQTRPLCDVPKMIYGSKPVDDGNFFLTDEEKEKLLQEEPNSLKYIKPILSSHEFINGKKRWCLWLKELNPSDLKMLPQVLKRIQNVREFRLKSTKESVKKQADIPSLFSEIRQPQNDYVIIPRHSSENRKYIPFGFFGKEVIVSDSCTALPNASLFHFGVLHSEMHNVWVQFTCGRIKSDYRYSNILVYNNFPWPEIPTEKQKAAIAAAAQAVLDARAQFANASLADLYDPNTMPPILVKAHQILDKAVDQCYRSQPFATETKRIEFLFELYDRYTSGMFGSKRIS